MAALVRTLFRPWPHCPSAARPPARDQPLPLLAAAATTARAFPHPDRKRIEAFGQIPVAVCPMLLGDQLSDRHLVPGQDRARGKRRTACLSRKALTGISITPRRAVINVMPLSAETLGLQRRCARSMRCGIAVHPLTPCSKTPDKFRTRPRECYKRLIRHIEQQN